MAATPLPSRPYKGTQPTHQTDKLAGYPAVDIMGKNGDPVVATEDGYVYRLGSAQGGRAFYMHGASGADYWYGHLGGYSARLKSVTSTNPVRVRQGEVLGFLGGHPTPHLHFGVHGANAATIASTPQAQGAPSLGDISKQGAGFFSWPPKFDTKGSPLDLSLSGVDIIEGITGKNYPDIDADPIKAIKSPFEAIGWFFSNWDRALEVMGGFILLIIGLILLGNKLGISQRAAGPLAVLQYGPTVQRAPSANLRPKVSHDVTGEPRRPSSGYNPSTSEIPF